MAVRPGEELVATVFSDVHYFYGPPTASPPHHRFSKSSYLYLYENAHHRRGRIEIANHAGSPDQDAFTGYLDLVKVHYDYQHPTLLTITIDYFHPNSAGSSAPPPQDDNEWRLPTYDPTNQNKYMYRLHTIDAYLWTKEDAELVLGALRRILPQDHVEVVGEPPAPVSAHEQAISPVVQQLESMAISHGAPQQQQQQAQPQQQQAQHSFAPPPTSAFGAGPAPPQAAAPAAAPAAFAPIAYNPAAPAAPEQIRHREKTPPPEDDAPNPLLMAAAQDQSAQFNPHFQPQPLQRHYTTGNVASPASASTQMYFTGPPSQAVNTQAAAAPTPGFAPPPNAEPVVAAPEGGYAAYTYTGGSAGTPTGVDAYAIHNQVYRPTEKEHKVFATGGPEGQGGTGTDRLGKTAVKVEGKLTGMLRKFEKKYG